MLASLIYSSDKAFVRSRYGKIPYMPNLQPRHGIPRTCNYAHCVLMCDPLQNGFLTGKVMLHFDFEHTEGQKAEAFSQWPKSVTNPFSSQKHGMVALGCLSVKHTGKVSPTQNPVKNTVWSLLGVHRMFDREKCHQPKSRLKTRFGRSWVCLG